MDVLDKVSLAILTITWSTVYTVAGYTTKFFPPIFLYSLRFLIGGLILLPFAKFPKNNKKKIIQFGLLQALTFLGITLSIKHIDTSISAIIMRFDIPLIILIAHIKFKEKITINLIISIIISLFGIYLLNTSNNEEFDSLYIIIMIISAILSALSHIVSKEIGNDKINNTTISCYSFLVMGICLLIFSFIFKENGFESILNSDLKAKILLLYLSLVPSILGYNCLHFIMRRQPTIKTMPWGFTRPIIAVISSYLILNETITIQKVIAIILITFAVFLAEYKQNR